MRNKNINKIIILQLHNILSWVSETTEEVFANVQTDAGLEPSHRTIRRRARQKRHGSHRRCSATSDCKQPTKPGTALRHMNYPLFCVSASWVACQPSPRSNQFVCPSAAPPIPSHRLLDTVFVTHPAHSCPCVY